MTMKLKHGDRPGFWRLSWAARLAGVTAEAFEAASLAGTIPVRVEELNNWLQSKGNNS